MARVVVVGGGFGGTASAARLAKLGHDVVLLERRDVLGGALGWVEQDGFRWDSGPTATALPAVLRDLFRKSGRPLDRVLDLVPVEPVREHRFQDGTSLLLPSGSRAAQLEAVDASLGEGAGQQWVDHVHAYAEQWDLIRRVYLERPWSPDHVDRATRSLLRTRTSLLRAVQRSLADPRLREVALYPSRLDGHQPRDVPAWVGMWDYVEQNFGVWTVPGGMGQLAEALTTRLRERRVDVRTGTTVDDLVLEGSTVTGVHTSAESGTGTVEADVVVVAVDPRRLPSLAPYVERTTPAVPPVVTHLGLAAGAPGIAHEVVLHGDPLLVVRDNGPGPDGGRAWTVLARGGRLSEDLTVALARRDLDVRSLVRTRVDRSPRDLAEQYAGSPYGTLWQGRATVDRKLAAAPFEGLHTAGASVAAGAGLPYVGLSAAVVAERVGKA